MGALMSRFWFALFPAKEYKIVVVGLDNAGKTTTLYKLHLGEVVSTNPTIGSNVEEVVYKNIRFEVWDLGGQESLRPSWATYFRGTHAVIAVIDSTDRVRINIIKDELFRLLAHGDLESTVVLVFANKQDLKDAMKPAEITDAMGLHNIKNHDWHIQRFLMDSTDRVRVNIIKDKLFRLLAHGDLESAVVLVFVNKQDLKDAMKPAEITDAMGLHNIKNHDWHIQACCALTGEGLYDGLGWIAEKVAGKSTQASSSS